MTEEDIIKSIRNYFDVDDKKDFNAAISQCDKEELKRKIVNQSLHINCSKLCDGIENVINYLTNLKEQGYTNISDFEVYKYGKEDDNEYQIRIERLIRDKIEHIRKKRRGTI